MIIDWLAMIVASVARMTNGKRNSSGAIKLNAAVQRIMAEPAFRARFMAPNFFEQLSGTPDQFAALIKEDAARWGKVIGEAGLKAKE